MRSTTEGEVEAKEEDKRAKVHGRKSMKSFMF